MHRARRATTPCAKSRPPPKAVAFRSPLDGVACLASSFGYLPGAALLASGLLNAIQAIAGDGDRP
jgi:hypothetical protein